MSEVAFRLPDVGEGLDEAEVVRWLVGEGEEVARDQPLVEVLTDKAQVELPSPVAGRVLRLAAAEGDIIKVGTLLVELTTAAGSSGGLQPGPAAEAGPAGEVAPGAEVALAAEPVPGAAVPGAAAPAAPPAGLRPKASPSTRRLAAQLGVDLAGLPGTGPGGRVSADDVRAAAEGGPPPPASTPRSAPVPAAPATPAGLTTGASTGSGRAAGSTGRREPSAVRLGWMEVGTHPLRGIRRVTVAAMTRSWSEIPHITGMDEVDATALLDARDRLRAVGGDGVGGLTPLALLAFAACRALRRYPLVNASVDAEAGTITVPEQVNLGIAVATEDGLVVPVVAAADRRSLADLATEVNRLASAARARRLTPGELRGGTFTITNYGALGGRFATPLVRPGEVGILGFGAIRPRPLVHEGRVEARPALPVVFSADHRLVDGDLATAFQEQILAYVREPLTLLLEG